MRSRRKPQKRFGYGLDFIRRNGSGVFRIRPKKGLEMMDFYFYLGLAVPVLIGAILFKD